MAGAEAAASTTIVNALRYDGYGQLMGSPYTAGGAIGLDHRHQGRLELSPSASVSLYDSIAREYAPSLGTFTSLDSVMGSPIAPATLNRFLYAHGNPTSLIDPTGHDACTFDCDSDYDDGAVSRGNHDPTPTPTPTCSSSICNSSGGGGGGGNSGGGSNNGVKADPVVSTPKTGNAPQQGGLPFGDIASGVWDSVSNFTIGAVQSTYHFATCGLAPGAQYSPMCSDSADNFRALADADFARARTQAELYALAGAFGDAERNLKSGDPYTVARAVTDVVLFSALLAGPAKSARLGPVRAGARSDTTELLGQHVSAATERFEVQGMTRRQALRVAENPGLKDAFRGERIDTFAKESAALDPRLAHIKITGRFKFGADFVNPRTGQWWDITTLKQWPAHQVKYGPGGTRLPY